MLLVAESGSTKADWMLVDNGIETIFVTMGFNPYFHTKEDILHELNGNYDLQIIKDAVTELHFYGAGCSIPELNTKVKSSLSIYFTNAVVKVDHDLKACAYACYQGVPEIACILGTGSNSCFFDGKNLTEAIPAVGHILGDEGSGSYFGKRILSDFLYKRLPNAMNEELEDLGLNKEVIIDHVYMQSNANVYIASFMPILIRHKKLQYCQDVIREGIQKFIDIHVKCYDNYAETEVNFVGSMSFLLKEELYSICEKDGIEIGTIIRKPLQNLVQFHLQESQAS
ncbi:MAG: glucosamine kinase [Crocinitomix sp.]|jgi:glucosamine kinase